MAKANTITRRKGPKADAVPTVAAEPEVFGPAISAKKVHEMEIAATSDARGQQRRILLMVLSKNAEDLAKISDENPDLHREMRKMVHAFVTHARSMVEVGQAAIRRLMVTDLREDTSKEDEEAMTLLNEGGAA